MTVSEFVLEPKHLPLEIARLNANLAAAVEPGPVAGACFTEINVMGVDKKDTVTVALPVVVHVDVTVGWRKSEHFCFPPESEQVAPSICLPGDAAPAAVTASSRKTMWSAM